jgi:transcriptional regulator with XRE-family HTH domain
MPELGKTLSQARVARGLTLEDCERDTRISKRYLDALEREDWRIFPAPVYSRAFLRTYAQYLGLSPVDLMRLYQQQTEEPQPVVKPLPEIPAAPATGSINWALAAGVAVLVAVAGAFLFFSSLGGGGADGTTVTAPTAAVPTVDPESEGGGQQPAVGRPVGEVEEGIVPDLRDVRVTDAINALRQAGIQYVIVEQDAAGGTPGVVTSQNPEPGSDANGDTSVTLIVPAQ